MTLASSNENLPISVNKMNQLCELVGPKPNTARNKYMIMDTEITSMTITLSSNDNKDWITSDPKVYIKMKMVQYYIFLGLISGAEY